jgi:energy-coupling factor transporter ATP-binding protein EcfA2
LVTGKTGSGKSTTLAAMIDDINTREKGHILTIEDPIEFVHVRKNCLISQREIGVHAASFSSALLSALREDPGRDSGGRASRPRDHEHRGDRGGDGNSRHGYAAHQRAAATVDRW